MKQLIFLISICFLVYSCSEDSLIENDSLVNESEFQSDLLNRDRTTKEGTTEGCDCDDFGTPNIEIIAEAGECCTYRVTLKGVSGADLDCYAYTQTTKGGIASVPLGMGSSNDPDAIVSSVMVAACADTPTTFTVTLNGEVCFSQELNCSLLPPPPDPECNCDTYDFGIVRKPNTPETTPGCCDFYFESPGNGDGTTACIVTTTFTQGDDIWGGTGGTSTAGGGTYHFTVCQEPMNVTVTIDGEECFNETVDCDTLPHCEPHVEYTYDPFIIVGCTGVDQQFYVASKFELDMWCNECCLEEFGGSQITNEYEITTEIISNGIITQLDKLEHSETNWCKSWFQGSNSNIDCSQLQVGDVFRITINIEISTDGCDLLGPSSITSVLEHQLTAHDLECCQ